MGNLQINQLSLAKIQVLDHIKINQKVNEALFFSGSKGEYDHREGCFSCTYQSMCLGQPLKKLKFAICRTPGQCFLSKMHHQALVPSLLTSSWQKAYIYAAQNYDILEG